MRARARLRVGLDSGGTARVTELRSATPVLIRRTGGSGNVVEIHLVGGAGGPLAGDDLGLDIAVGAGAVLVVGSVAATVALPGRGAGPSTFTVRAEVGAGGELAFLPEPTIVARGARHRLISRITLAAGARLRYREEILLGRFGEPGGNLTTSLHVDVDVPADATGPGRRRALLRQELRLGPEVPGVHGPAVLAGARAVGSVLLAGPLTGLDALASPVGNGVALMPLSGPGVLVSALADDGLTLRRRLDALTGALSFGH
ncbi:urease accessory protein UreD [Parafrankia elaeagni]|uniref:urease accessory protein UreD n=1 Tax=Parafrankia elaeagni TaxID=222534 RepID=UPI00389968CF